MKILALAGLTTVFAVLLPAQESDTSVEVRQKTITLAGTGGNFAYIGAQMIGGSPVKNAPYSAEAVTESTQTLADGNRIVHKASSMQYRDSEGRERREETLAGLGALAPGMEMPMTVFISDPVAGTSYSLTPTRRTAFKMPAPGAMPMPMMMPPPEGLVGGRTMVRIEKTAINGIMTESSSPGARKSESLGNQTIEGVQAQGTRVVETIVAGQVGNEQPIQVVNESWYSPDLKMVVMTRHSDPRTGEQTYRLTNISRTEPVRSLFEVPSDYTVADGPGKALFINGAPVPKAQQ